MNKKILRPDEVASFLRISKRGVYRLISSGDLPAFKVGGALRISSQALESFIDRQMAEHELETGLVNDCDRL
jgi:excisionase family DNA binding protein